MRPMVAWLLLAGLFVCYATLSERWNPNQAWPMAFGWLSLAGALTMGLTHLVRGFRGWGPGRRLAAGLALAAIPFAVTAFGAYPGTHTGSVALWLAYWLAAAIVVIVYWGVLAWQAGHAIAARLRAR